MARCKSSPEVVRAKCELANRLREIRTEQYGERGGPELARRLNLPIRTWYNYETGVTVPSEVLLRFIELTDVEPGWLLHGQGPRYRRRRPSPAVEVGEYLPGSVGDLLRRALAMLETNQDGDDEVFPQILPPRPEGDGLLADEVVVRVEDAGGGPDAAETVLSLPMKRYWIASHRRFRAYRIRDEAMAPLIEDGAVVGVAERPEAAEALNGSLVAARIGGRLVVRWLQLAGRVALLRAEDPAAEPEVMPIDEEEEGESASADSGQLRRVLWIYSPHGEAPAKPTVS
ncbi:XRE family transcriptional regulator [Tautonia sociabilis]|uniref:LexA family transcriptional regulator n=1 Tax=Tautonia sociabilis TaxID=2080755 RepID=A0A432MGS4_9BACT|nr:XRE family transcriptional regulator [Tautonia sociabilis]RUL86098.1 LexA family transcriptional regulator [Tautonia sociabilis]